VIVTPAAIVYGVLAVMGILAGGALVAISVAGWRAASPAALVLGLALGQAALVIRVLSWPVLYWVLASYVPMIPGAMCIYGVTQSMRRLTAVLEIVEPVALVIAGAVFLVLGAYRAGRRGVTVRRILAHLAVGGVLSLVASLAGLAFLVHPKATREVSCCSVVFDDPLRSPLVAGGLVLGRDAGRLALAAAQALGLALLFAQAWTAIVPHGRAWRWALTALLALVHAAAAVFALFQTISPVLTGMARHHCAYCLGDPQHVPTALAIAGLALLGLATAVPIWLLWLRLAVPDDPGTPEGRGGASGADPGTPEGRGGASGADPGSAAPGTAGRMLWPALSLASLVGWWLLVLVPYGLRLRSG
jgi:hypothetical protein